MTGSYEPTSVPAEFRDAVHDRVGIWKAEQSHEQHARFADSRILMAFTEVGTSEPWLLISLEDPDDGTVLPCLGFPLRDIGFKLIARGDGYGLVQER